MPSNYILFAEDDLEDQMILSETFKEGGLSDEIVFVQDGEKLLTRIEDEVTKRLPSLIVLDLNMPLLNGTETLRRLKSHDQYKNIPVIIYSTSVNHFEKETCLQLGAINYIIKPSNYDECIKIVTYFRTFSS